MFSLADKIALVTGAGSGIGEAIARCLGAAGAKVYIADRDTTNGQRVANTINSMGASATFVQIDVAEEVSCGAATEIVMAQQGRCDILVNNAGIGHVGALPQTTAADLDRLWAVNLR